MKTPLRVLLKSRIDYMNPKHCLAFISLFLASLVVILVLAFESPDMLDYNLGDSYTCAENFKDGP